MTENLTPEILLRAYAMGIFPMAETQDDPRSQWVDPRRRGVFPWDKVHISRRLARTLQQQNYTIRTNSAFEAVVDGCAARTETWINREIRAAYLGLYRAGHAVSLEVWVDDVLEGGVYGVTLGAAFFGESMFSARRDASKIALAWLIHRLRAGGYQLFDTQFLTPHLASLGAVEIARAEYHRQLAVAVGATARFDPPGYSPSASSVISASGGV